MTRRQRRLFWRKHLASRTFAPDETKSASAPTPRLLNFIAAVLIGICVLVLVAGAIVLINLPNIINSAK